MSESEGLLQKSAKFEVKRVRVATDPFADLAREKVPERPWSQLYSWPARFVSPSGGSVESTPGVQAYRLVLRVEEASKLRLLITADQGYWFYINGVRVGEGSEVGCLNEWFYDGYDVEFEPGEYVLGAICWWLGAFSPKRRISVEPAFLLASPDPEFRDLVSTGIADWQGRRVEGAEFLDSSEQLGRMCLSGGRLRYRGGSWSEELSADCPGWDPVVDGRFGLSRFVQYANNQKRLLTPARLPAMKEKRFQHCRLVYASSEYEHGAKIGSGCLSPDEEARWEASLEGRKGDRPVVLPAASRIAFLLRLEDYVCARYRLKMQGGRGARVSVGWAEGLSVDPLAYVAAPDRRQVEGRYFVGLEDEFIVEGESDSELEPLDWVSGCWIRIMLETADEALEIDGLEIFETGYPFERTAAFECSDRDLESIWKVGFRTLENCSHDAYMDCPFWERLQYWEDARIQLLVTYAATQDCELPKKAISIFNHSVLGAASLPSSSFPASSLQLIPPFALGWVDSLRDFALWRGEAEFLRAQLPLAWLIVERFLLARREDGLVANLEGWNFVDTGDFGEGSSFLLPGEVSGTVQWKVVSALEALEDVCSWLGERELAQRARRCARELVEAVQRRLWCESRAAFAEDVERSYFAEHSQALAALSRHVSGEMHEALGLALASGNSLKRASGYFSHYVLEAFRKLGMGEHLVARIGEWKAFIEARLHTFPESEVEGRSDCHAWNAHPSYHLLASALGVRPSGFGFSSVSIAPLLGGLESVSGKFRHPFGLIEVGAERQGPSLLVWIRLPEELSGSCEVAGERRELSSGYSELRFDV